MSNSLKDQLLALGLTPRKTGSRPKTQHKPRPGPAKAQDTRHILQAALDAMPAKAAKLLAGNERSSQGKARPKNNKSVAPKAGKTQSAERIMP